METVSQGAFLAVIGMSVVFCFLLFMTFMMQFSGFICRKFEEKTPAETASKSGVPKIDTTGIAIAIAAVHTRSK
ncbi:MAG: OadG family protein [Chitinispirillaceae bacterium]|jgi:sodium pump decarboxylase gamma subunit|nr:OadG family protein [Chitinispirillaceae bacterium]